MIMSLFWLSSTATDHLTIQGLFRVNTSKNEIWLNVVKNNKYTNKGLTAGTHNSNRAIYAAAQVAARPIARQRPAIIVIAFLLCTAIAIARGWNPLKLIRCSSDFLSQDVDDSVDAVANIQTSYGNSVLVGARLFYFVWSQKAPKLPLG